MNQANYSLTAKATDNNRNVTTSEVVNIFVLSNAPQAKGILSESLADATIKPNSKLSLQLAPNPADNILNIYTTGLQKNKQAILSVISSEGVVMQPKLLSSSAQTVQLNVSSLVSGVYIIKLLSGDKILYKQFVKF